MRYSEIIDENLVGQRVWSATQRKSAAQRRYQEKMRAIPRTTPQADAGAKAAAARQEFQSAMTKADDSIRNAATPKPSAES
jgi:hypothetical protein